MDKITYAEEGLEESKYKVGYVDENPQEVGKITRKLEDYFDMVGYHIPRGLSEQELINQIYSSGIDLLMVDYLLTDKGILTYNGDAVVRDYEKITTFPDDHFY